MAASIGDFSSPRGLAITPDGARAYVANTNFFNVKMIGTATNTVTTTIGGFSGPTWDMAITPGGTLAYVSNGAGSVSAVDTATNTVTAVISVAPTPRGWRLPA